MFESRHKVIAPALALAITSMALIGCSATKDGDPYPLTPAPVANFSDVTGKIPYPFDYFFTGSADGTLNIPATITWHSFRTSLNALDGWSTNAAIDTSFSQPIDPTSISGTSVKVIKLWVDYTTKAPCASAACLPAGATSPVAGVLTYGTDFTAEVSPAIDAGGKFLQIIPLKPLEASKGPAANSGGPNAGKVLNVGYLVVLTNDLKSTDGEAFAPDTLYASVKPPASCGTLAVAYQGLCAVTQAHLGIAQAAAGVDPAKAIVSWWFSTQSVDDVLAVATASATAQQTLIVPTGMSTQVVNPAFGKADIYVGSTQLPYYLTVPANANDSASVLTKNWTGAAGSNLTMFNPTPVNPNAGNVTVPLLVTIPNAASGCVKPASGWPVVVFQHGITGNRTQALPIADAYANACVVVAAIDLPWHGITDTASPFYCTPAKPQCIGATERTFDIDIMNNSTGKAPADGVIDPSGGKDGLTYFNFFNPLVFRDNLRQSSIDMGNLTKSIVGLAFAAPVVAPVGIDATQVHFIGHSQGAISGTAHVKFSSGTRTAVLANPGGPISLIAQDEDGYFAQVAKNLVSALTPAYGYNYYMVFRDLQAVIDAGDPYNHIKGAAARHPVLMFEVKGDTTITNAATDSLIATGGLTKVKTLGANPVGAGAYTLFSQGSHGTLLDFVNQPATIEMQMQAAYFAATAAMPGGPFVTLTNPAVLDLN